MSENENEPAKEVGWTLHEQPQTSKKQQEKIQLKAFLKPQTPILTGDNSASKGKEQVLDLIPKAMEEEPERIDLEGLDLIGLEDAFNNKDFRSISE